jgi:glutamate synthase (NADPH) small chain
MGKLRGFVEIERVKPSSRPVHDRLKDWREFELPLP